LPSECVACAGGSRADLIAIMTNARRNTDRRDLYVSDLRDVHDWASALDSAAANTCNEAERKALQRASRALFHQPAGRRQKFADAAADRARIVEARHLFETGKVASEWAAYMKVAATIPGPSQRSIAERLRRKAARENHPRNSIGG
jgi:hypothetical protein